MAAQVTKHSILEEWSQYVGDILKKPTPKLSPKPLDDFQLDNRMMEDWEEEQKPL